MTASSTTSQGTASQSTAPQDTASSDRNTYDETPYPDLSYAHTHPDRLATLGHLLGLGVAPAEQCRVLELGCAGGGNLLPMALHLPQSRFVGIDYSAHQIDIGHSRLAKVGTRNLQLLCMDVLDTNAPTRLARSVGGKFDYIIAHGFYSWVTKPVRDAMFALCKRILAPQGILYVSYNTLPGWNIIRSVREAMLFHARAAADPGEVSRLAREMVDFLAAHIPEEHNAYRAVFQRYQHELNAGMKATSAAFLLHDELETVNEPVYFRDFAAHAATYGLQYFVEAELANVLPHVFGNEALQQMQNMATSAVELEQYMDFLRNRMFRQSLLCHDNAEPTRMLRPDPIMSCYVRSEAAPEKSLTTHLDGTLHPDQGQVAFLAPDQAKLTTDHPLSQAAFLLLRARWPAALHFDELVTAALALLGTAAPDANDAQRMAQERMVLAANLLRGYGHSTRLVNLHRMRPPVPTLRDLNSAAAADWRPMAAPAPRFEAGIRNTVTNLWHERVQLSEPKRQLLLLLDGTKTIAELEPIWRLALRHSARTGPTNPPASEPEIQVELDWIARASLLMQPDTQSPPL